MEPILNKKQSNFPNSINQNSTQLTTKEAGNQNREMFVCLDDNELEKITGSSYGGLVYLVGECACGARETQTSPVDVDVQLTLPIPKPTIKIKK